MVETAEAKQVSRAASSVLFPELDFGVADKAMYPSEDFQRVLARIAFDNEFANAGAKAYQLARGDDIDVEAGSRNPLARALLYHLRGLDADAVTTQFDRVRDAVLDEAARNRLFTQPVDVAIDVHDWLYYGDSDTPHVSRTDPDRGTDCAYKFATICIVDPNFRFTLGWVALDGDDTDELADALRQLVSQAREYVEINRVYLDRGFYRIHLALALEEMGIEFVMRAPQTRKVQRFIADRDEEKFVAEYEMARSNPPTGHPLRDVCSNPEAYASGAVRRGRTRMGRLSRYDYALLAIPLALLASVVAGVASALSMSVALSAGSLVGTGVIYEVLVRRPPGR